MLPYWHQANKKTCRLCVTRWRTFFFGGNQVGSRLKYQIPHDIHRVSKQYVRA
jgi:hypothetical protein